MQLLLEVGCIIYLAFMPFPILIGTCHYQDLYCSGIFPFGTFPLQELSLSGSIFLRNFSLRKLSFSGTFLYRSYPFQELFSTEAILFRNFSLRKLSFSGSFLYRSYPFQELFSTEAILLRKFPFRELSFSGNFLLRIDPCLVFFVGITILQFVPLQCDVWIIDVEHEVLYFFSSSTVCSSSAVFSGLLSGTTSCSKVSKISTLPSSLVTMSFSF